MLPSILAKQLERGIGDYIETSFPMTNGPFRGSVHNMLQTRGAVYHEPYVSGACRSEVLPHHHRQHHAGCPVECTIEYVTPFDCCDVAQDYKTAWKFFEEKYGGSP